MTGAPAGRSIGDDSGASLTMALVVVTVFSIIVAILLSFADTSLRNTIELRDQASDTAGAEGAAQIAINALRRGSYDTTTGSCFTQGSTGSNTLTLNGFYQPATGAADSAAVACSPITAQTFVSKVAISSANKPANAVLTLGNTAEDGVHVDAVAGQTVKVHGPVLSQSAVNVAGAGGLSVDASLRAASCTGTVTASPATCGAPPTVPPVDYPVPNGDMTVQTVPFCDTPNQMITFTPGLYRDLTELDLRTRCSNGIFYFPPGIYYFDFDGDRNHPDGEWTIKDGYLLAGTQVKAPAAGTPPAIPGTCRTPFPPKPPVTNWTAQGSTAPGVQFVFAGNSHIVLQNSRAEICGTYSATAPPIAVYGLAAPFKTLPAASGCVVLTPYPANGCALIRTDNSSNTRLYVQGTTYAPAAALDIALSNPGGLVFSAGVIARTLRLAPTAAAGLSDPVIEIPDDAPLGRRQVIDLAVYLCPGSPTCTVAGAPRLRVRVGILDPTGDVVAGSRQIAIYAWSMQR